MINLLIINYIIYSNLVLVIIRIAYCVKTKKDTKSLH